MNKELNGPCKKAYIVKQRCKPSKSQNGVTNQCCALVCSQNLIKFHTEKAGQIGRRAVYLQNNRNLPVGYSIDCECVTADKTSVISSTFPLIYGQRIGYVPAKSRILLLFGFYPSFEGCHVRKLEITTPGQLPLNLLLVGYYGVTETQRRWTQKELFELTRWQGSLPHTVMNILKPAVPQTASSPLLSTETEIDFTPTLNESTVAYEWAKRSLSLQNGEPIPTESSEASAHLAGVCFARRVIVTNNYSRPCLLQWAPLRLAPAWKNTNKFNPPEPYRLNAAGQDAVSHWPFKIQPLSARIELKSRAEFCIQFRPDATNTYFERIFEGFAFWDEQEPNVAEFRVPELVTVKCWGHTYQNLSVNNPSSVVVTPSSPKFHALALDSGSLAQRLAFSSVMLSNLSDDLPLSYQIEFSSRSLGDCEIECDFDEKLPKARAQLVCVSRGGFLQPREFRVLPMITYLPKDKKTDFIISSLTNQGVLHTTCCLQQAIRFPHWPEMDLRIPATILLGVCEIQFESDDSIYLPPTAKGGRSNKHYRVDNPSNFPLKYSWDIPETYNGILDISPKYGTIAAESSQSFTWSFTPTSAGRDSIEVVFEFTYAEPSDAEVFSFLPSNPGTTKKRTLTVILISEEGVLSVKSSLLDLGPIAVGTSVVTSITLTNLTMCPLNVHLGVSHRCTTPAPGEETKPSMTSSRGWTSTESGICILERTALFIPAQGSQLLAITVKPSAAKNFECLLYYSCPAANAQDQTGQLSQNGDKIREERDRSILTTVRFRGVYPTLRFTDVIIEGPPPKLGRYRAWQELQLSRINECLQAQPTATERKHSNGPISRLPLLPTFEIQLGVAPQSDGSKSNNQMLKELRGTQNGVYFGGPDTQAFLQNYAASADELHSFLVGLQSGGSTQVFLRLENSGSVPAEIQFLFPSQLRPPRENWLEAVYISEETKEQMKTEEAEIFEITPRSCSLACGESVRIRIACRHHLPGHHKLPVCVRITNGRELVFTLQSLTLEPRTAYLQPLCESLTLPPVSLQCMQTDRKGVLQSFQMQNPSELPVYFRVTGCKLIVNEGEEPFVSCDSYLSQLGVDHPLIELQTTEDTILPGGIAKVNWIFRPMESREYKVRFTLTFADASRALGERPSSGCSPNQSISVDVSLRVYDSNLINPNELWVLEGNASLDSLYETKHTSAFCQPPLTLPWQCIFLSEQIVDCGLTAVHNSTHRIMFMSYRRPILAQDDDKLLPALFRWEPLLADYAKDCSVEPNEGVIELGQTVKITFNVHGGPVAKFFDMDFVCKIAPQPADNGDLEGYLVASEKRKSDKKPSCEKRVWPLEDAQVVTVTARSLSYDEMKQQEAWIFPPRLPRAVAAQSQKSSENSLDVCRKVLSDMLASLLEEKHFLKTLVSATFSPEKDPDCQETVIDDPVPFWRQVRRNKPELDLLGGSEACREPRTTPEHVKSVGVQSKQRVATEAIRKSLAECAQDNIHPEDSQLQDMMRKLKGCQDCRLSCEGLLRRLISDLCTAEVLGECFELPNASEKASNF